MKALNLLLYFFLLISCGNSNNDAVSQESGNKEITSGDPISEIESSYKVKVTPTSLPDGKNSGSQNTYSIKIDNLNLETKLPYKPIFIASKAARIIYNSFTTEEKKKIETININVNSIFKMDVYTYKPSDIERMEPYLKMGSSAARKYIDEDYEGFYSLINPDYIKREDFDKLITNHRKPYPEAFEGIKEIKDNGIEFRREDGLNIISTNFTTVSSGNKQLEWEIIYLDNEQDTKIVGFVIDEAN